MKLSEAEKRFLEAALIVNGLCLGLFIVRIFVTGFNRFWFIPENLLLAWLAFFFGWMLVRYLKTNPWRSWPAVLFSVLWLVFVPNCWYVLTDFVHMTYTAEISQLFDIALFASLVASGFMAGYASLVLIHKQLLKHFKHGLSTLIVLGVIVFASFAIYLGRDLRWNSVDIVMNPGGLALNVSDRLIDPFGRPRMVNVTSLFFVTITAGYWAVWRLSKPHN